MNIKNVIKLFLIVIISTTFLFAQNNTSKFREFLANKDYENAGAIAEMAMADNPKNAELALEAGDVFMELEDYNKAYVAYSKARELESKDNNILAKLTKALIAIDRADEAINEINKVISKDKKNANLYIALANAYLSKGDMKNAEVQITNARSIDDKNPEVFTMLGNIYYSQDVWELAKMNYEEALKLDANNIPARQRLADVYWKLAVAADAAGDKELLNEYINRSLDECNILVRNDEKDANSWRLKGQIHFNANQNLEAAQSYNKFLELRPNNFKERWRLAELLVQNGVYDSTITHLNLILNSDNKDVTDSIKQMAELYIGTCYYQTKQYNECIQVLNTIDKKHPLGNDDLKRLALAYLFATDTTTALGVFDRLFTQDPEGSCDLQLLVGARIYNTKKMYEDVIRVLSIRNKSCPADANTPYSYYLIGIAYFSLNQPDASITALQEAIKIDPNYFYARIYLGDVYYNQKKNAEGEAEWQYVLDNAKADPVKYSSEISAAYTKIAGNRLDAKKYADLQKIAKEWIELIPEKNEYGYLYLAVACQGLGDQAGACKNYNEVLKINPDNKTAKDNRKNLGC